MQRAYHRWHAHRLGREMELLVFGTGGAPTIVFPTSMGTFYDYEDRGMVNAVEDKINRGIVQLFCVSTVDTESFYANDRPPRARLERYLAYERYLVEDVVPFVVHTNGSTSIGLTGCSFGAYHAFVMALRHPAIFTSSIPMGGAFDITQFLDGYYDQDAYLLCPPHFLPGLDDPSYLDRYRRNKWVLVTGERDICRGQTEQAAAQLAAKQIPHSLHVWGNGSEHDWPEWRKMANAYIP